MVTGMTRRPTEARVSAPLSRLAVGESCTIAEECPGVAGVWEGGEERARRSRMEASVEK